MDSLSDVINETFPVGPGDNVIEARAETVDADPEFAAAESVVRRWVVRVPAEKAAPPTFVIDAVSSATGPVRDDKPVTVNVNFKVRYNGEFVKPSLTTLLEDFYERGDRQRLYLARLELAP